MLKRSTSGHPSISGLLICSLLIWISVLFGEGSWQQHGDRKPHSPFHFAVPVSGSDTTSPNPIQEWSCREYDWFDAPENGWESLSSSSLPGAHYTSLHELTCMWAAYQRGLSLDSTRLPKYVQPTGDSLRLGKDILAYGVKMSPADPERTEQSELYLVAEVADSLFYEKIGDARPYKDDSPSTVRIRAMRLIDVPGGESQYFWAEVETQTVSKGRSPTEIHTRWHGHIFTYDHPRGMRHLERAPVREELRRSGKLVGAEQWDVSVPEPGIMKVSPRLKRGKVGAEGVGDRVSVGPREWLGKHVIDKTVTTKREIEMPRSNLTRIIDTTEVENWEEKREQ